MINSLNDAGLPKPEFKEEAAGFSLFMWQMPSKEDLKEEGLKNRQQKAIDYLLIEGKITNREYRELNPGTDPATATKELQDLVNKGITLSKGKLKSTYYFLKDI
jgi:ATP-dependent DNA helicase RecG